MNAKNQTAADLPFADLRNTEVRLSVVRPADLPEWRTLITAVNFYVGTSGAVGEGVLVDWKGTRSLLIPVHTRNSMNVRDLEKLKSRVSELPAEWDVRLERIAAAPSLVGVDSWWLHLPNTRRDELSRALLRRPGALGWGSLVDQLASYDYEELVCAVASLGLPILPEPVRSELLRRTMRRMALEQA